MQIQQELPSKPSASELKKLQGEVDTARTEAIKRFDSELGSLREKNDECKLKSDQDKAATTVKPTITPEIKIESKPKRKSGESKPSGGDEPKPKRKSKSQDQHESKSQNPHSPLNDSPTGDSTISSLTD